MQYTRFSAFRQDQRSSVALFHPLGFRGFDVFWKGGARNLSVSQSPRAEPRMKVDLNANHSSVVSVVC